MKTCVPDLSLIFKPWCYHTAHLLVGKLNLQGIEYPGLTCSSQEIWKPEGQCKQHREQANR